jgi:hypothetical protein
MSERLALSPLEYGQKKIEVVRGVGQTALTIVNNRYGSGYPDFCAGEVSLGNHNGHHGFKVGDDTARLIEARGFDEFTIELGRATGNAHDIIQGRGRGIDEGESAEWTESELRKEGASSFAARLAGAAIRGTQPLFDKDGVNDQMVNQMEFDSRFAEIFAQALASGDFGELYTPLGPLLAHNLYSEMQGTDAMDDFQEFSRKQAILHNRYQYPLGKQAEDMLATHKAQVIRYMEYVYDQCVRGNIESFDQIIRQDERFARDPNMRLA